MITVKLEPGNPQVSVSVHLLDVFVISLDCGSWGRLSIETKKKFLELVEYQDRKVGK